MKEKGGYSFGGDHFFDRAENYLLYKTMVDHDQQRVKAGGGKEVSDEVTGDLLKGMGRAGFDQSEQENGGMCV